MNFPNRNKKAVRGWAFYDWANSVYALAITTAILPIYYNGVSHSNKVLVREEDSNAIVSFFGFELPSSSLYSYALSFAYLIIAFLSPILGGIADYSGIKKKFMMFFCAMGAFSSAGLFFFTPENYELGIIFFMLAAIGFAGGNIFNDAFLPEITTPDNYDRVSAFGFSLGYIGSTIQLIISLVLIMNFKAFGFEDSSSATRWMFIFVGIWWIGFAQITFFSLKETKPEKKTENILTKGWEELRKVLKQIRANSNVKLFLIAFLFFNMGIQTVMMMATLFGTDELKLESDELIIAMLVIQLVAIGGSYLFSKLSAKLGNIQALGIGMVIWIIICVVAYFIQTNIQYYALGFLVGMVMGGVQSLSRGTFSKLIPEESHDNASFFSFFSITDKISIVLGLFVFGWINQLMGNMRYSILALIAFFIIGGTLLIILNKRVKLVMQRD